MPMWDEDEFDEELAIACGITEHEITNFFEFEDDLIRFNYVQDQWECSGCGNVENYDDGPRYYYNPETNNYDAPKPLTIKERMEQERLKQEAAGQLRLDI